MMKFPYDPAHLFHTSGSRILSVLAPFHEAHKPQEGFSQDAWGFQCLVEWIDTKKTSNASLYMHAIRHDGRDAGHAEFVKLSEAISEYLAANGAWRNKAPEGWYATSRPKGAGRPA